MVDDIPVLPVLEPPAGGLARLLAKRDRVRPWRPGLRALVPAATAILLLVVFVNSGNHADTVLRERLAAELEAGRAMDVRVENGAAIALPVSNDNVRIYVVMGTQPAEPPY